MFLFQLTSHLVQMHPEKFAGILMLAPAVNFHIRYEKVLHSQLTPKLLQKYKEGGVVTFYAPDYGEFPLSKAVFDDMERFTVTLESNKLPVSVPVRIIHGVKVGILPLLRGVGEVLFLNKNIKTCSNAKNFNCFKCETIGKNSFTNKNLDKWK